MLRTRRRQKNVGQDAIALLKKVHAKVQGLLNKLEKSNDRDKQRNIFAQIDSDLQIHTRIEEEIFYPAFKTAVKTSESNLYFEAVEEHHVVDMVLPEMRTSRLSKEIFAAKAKVLKDLVEHHIEEEENEMFPKARKALGSRQLADLGARMKRRKDQLMVGMWDQSLEILNPFASRSLKTDRFRNTGRSAVRKRAA
jgi:hemerythrin superfamily protein